MYAKAIFNNVADTADELEFRRGDLLTVIEQDTDGCKGWWLCKLRGRQGLCPGNRLRLITTYDSGCFSSPLSSTCPSLAASTTTLNSYSTEVFDSSVINCTEIGNQRYTSSSQSQDGPITYIQQQQHLGKRRSWHTSPNKVVTPQRYGDFYVYNCTTVNKPLATPYNHPTQQNQEIHYNQSIYQNISVMSTPSGCSEFETYDIPKAPSHLTYDCPKNLLRTQDKSMLKTCTPSKEEESYDIPRPLNSSLQQQNMMTPSTSNSSLLTSDCSFSSLSNRSSMNNMPDYDVPRRNPLPVRAMYQAGACSATSHQSITNNSQNQPERHQNMVNALSATYSLPLPTTQHNPIQANINKELPLELSSALDTLAKLQAEATTSITRLLSYVTPNWRIRDKIEPVVMDIKLSAVRLRTALHDLTEFGEGALGNARRSEDPTLALKLKPLVKALRDADKLISESSETLDAQGGWTLEKLSRDDENSSPNPPDSLDQLIACAQTLIEDVRQSTSFIQGNASLLFKRNVQNISVASAETMNNVDLVENYDYVCFESKDAATRTNSVLRDAIPQNLQKHFDDVLKVAETTSVAASNLFTEVHETELTEKDKVLVKYYTMQITTHMGNLRQAIDSFLETVEKNQPPKYFIAYGKFVVVSAHNLVTIGDIVHRNISKNELNQKILSCTDALSEALKTCVVKSKKAAAHFPSVIAVQEMVDSVVDISHLASDLKTAMMQAVQFTF